MFSYDELNSMPKEELSKIKQEEMDKAYKREKERQNLIQYILYLQNVQDVYKPIINK